MSKSKGGKNAKKQRVADHKKVVSDYQAGKSHDVTENIFINKKKERMLK